MVLFPHSQYIYVIQWFYFPESVYICDSMVLFPSQYIYVIQWFYSPESVYICDSMVLFPRVSIYMRFNGFISPVSIYM